MYIFVLFFWKICYSFTHTHILVKVIYLFKKQKIVRNHFGAERVGCC